MSESVVVNVSGTAFSLLLYENIRCTHDQEGFLLGEVVTNQKRTITDNDQEVVTIEHIIKVNSIVPCPRLGHFYDNAGKILHPRLEQYLQNKANSVTSWYKFKRTSSFKLSLREKIVMKQLAQYFMPSSPERFTCCLLTAQNSCEGGTHTFSQTFIRYFKSSYQPIPMHIVNLKDPYDVYKNPQKCSTSFANIIKTLEVNSNTQLGYATIDRIETAVDKHIEHVVKKLEKSEEERYNLEMRVAELRQKFLDNSKKESIKQSDSIEDAFANNVEENAEPARKKRGRKPKSAINSEKSPEKEYLQEEVQEKRVLRNSARKS